MAREFAGKPLDELADRVRELAAVARHFDGTLSIHSGSGKQAEVLESIGQSTAGRVNYKISGELQLQLFDVLSEQPAGSPWKGLYERMAERCDDSRRRGFRRGKRAGREVPRDGQRIVPRAMPSGAAWTAICSWCSGWAISWAAAM